MKALKDKRIELKEISFKADLLALDDYNRYWLKYGDAIYCIQEEREMLRRLIYEIAKEYGGSILHYNDKIDEIHNKVFGKIYK